MAKAKKKVTKKPNKHLCREDYFCETLRSKSDQGCSVGLNILRYVNINTGKTTALIPVVKLTKKEGGHMLNFCPFCGFDFSKRPDWRGDK